MEIETDLDKKKYRMEMYRILSCCYQQPGKGLKDQLDCNMMPVCSEAYEHFDKMTESFLSEDIESLKIDHARLFVGPYNLFAPPYGSVYLESEGPIMGDSSMEAKQIYSLMGLTTAIDFKDLPDHICSELEFMYFLAFKEIQAVSDGMEEDVLSLISIQRYFLMKHLGAWVFDFTDNIKKHAKTAFYRNLALTTSAFIEWDLNEFSGEPSCNEIPISLIDKSSGINTMG